MCVFLIYVFSFSPTAHSQFFFLRMLRTLPTQLWMLPTTLPTMLPITLPTTLFTMLPTTLPTMLLTNATHAALFATFPFHDTSQNHDKRFSMTLPMQPAILSRFLFCNATHESQ